VITNEVHTFGTSAFPMTCSAHCYTNLGSSYNNNTSRGWGNSFHGFVSFQSRGNRSLRNNRRNNMTSLFLCFFFFRLNSLDQGHSQQNHLCNSSGFDIAIDTGGGCFVPCDSALSRVGGNPHCDITIETRQRDGDCSSPDFEAIIVRQKTANGRS
jgi:hypothetical protein